MSDSPFKNSVKESQWPWRIAVYIALICGVVTFFGISSIPAVLAVIALGSILEFSIVKLIKWYYALDD